jgi:hypothetical protein
MLDAERSAPDFFEQNSPAGAAASQGKLNRQEENT